ncbi:MAG: ATP-binding protein [Hyphomicrobiales bacterium]|nr:ATP-binding protein [Hyphomicrobiales bacterium]
MYKRELAREIAQDLNENPAVAILGPRQIGKTTLALEIAETRSSNYLDLEKSRDFQRLKDVDHYLDLHADELVILDEVQRYPDLFMSLRGVIDARRREGRGNSRFLILGSASNKLLKQSSESLAGRICYHELTSLNPFEIEEPVGKPLQRLWMRGGFPDSYAAQSDRKSHKWRKNFIRTYLERDIPELGSRIPAATLMRFWTMLAHIQGELFNATSMAKPLGVKSVTVSRYLDLMVDLFLVRRLEPWHGNIKKQLVKSPKIYIRDSGILHALLQIPDYEELLGHSIRGKSWEGFVIENIISVLPFGIQPYFYRTSAGSEIDLLLEFGLNEYWAIEIKSNRTPTLKKGFHIACEDLKVQRKFVVYAGEDEFRDDNKTTVLSLSSFIETLRERTG